MTSGWSRRALASVGVALCVLVGAPVRAQTTGAIFTSGSVYLPGDSTGLVAIPLVHARGNDLLFTNLDTLEAHSVTSDDFVPGTNNTVRLFNSGPRNPRESVIVPGVPALAPGRYGFFCTRHSGMKGVLDVVG